MGVLRVRVGNQWVDLGASPVPPAGRRNLLDDASMQVNQRGMSVAGVTTSNYYTADRWMAAFNALGTYSITTHTAAGFGVPLPAGFAPTNVFDAFTSTIDAAPAAGDYAFFLQHIEGQNLQHLLFGTPTARPMTLSGWVYVGVAGTYYIELYQPTPDRWTTYPLALNGGWNYFAHTFPGNTVNAIANDVNSGLQVRFWFGAGSTYTTGTWAEGWNGVQVNRVPGQSNAIPAVINRVVGITQWQLEVGDVATPFEVVDYPTDLTRCRRYFNRWVDPPLRGSGTGGATTARMGCPLPVQMRINPAVIMGGTLLLYNGATGGTCNAVTANFSTTRVLECDIGGGPTYAVGQAVIMYQGSSGYLDIGADL